ncbi:hypothetical protein [Pseudomonas extremaustralis]|uniref:hypothetical protein n=1 Tax=Pseudomonas extremaustralis TaxID=359110 RepID=UPI00286307C9|nr:hypothetical protein [Pseudomonas extremaustralis]MDR6580031.1 ribosome modulation factor [Pseudomonas extremaustralis]
MASAELHGNKLRPFELGYQAFKNGTPLTQNPYQLEKDTSPVSMQRWIEGWNKAQREAGRKV